MLYKVVQLKINVMISLQRNYKMSDGNLVSTGMRVLVGANRDVATLTDFGWDQVRIDALEADRIAFADLPTDVELSGMMAEATAAKNLVRKNATDHCMVQVMLRVSQHYGEDSPTLKRFRAGDLHTATDHGFWLVLKRIHRQATLLLAALAPEGLTQAHLDTLAQFISDMNDSLLAQDTAIDNRDRAVQERIEAGNAFYAKLVKLADLGKRIHLNVDESKYNDYVLYPKAGGAEPTQEQQVFEEEVQAETVLNLSVTNLDGSETMTAHNTGTVPLTVYFAAMPTDLPDPDIGQLAPGQQATGTIAQAGFAAGAKEYLNVYNPSTDTVGSIELTVSG